MTKRLIILFTLICLIVGLSGCNFSIRESVEGKNVTLPPLRIDSTLVCRITTMDGNRCYVKVLEGNGNYDKDDELYVTYESVAKKEQVHHEDVITFEYNYVTSVAAIGNVPHILVDEVTVIKNYVPPVEPENTEAE